MRSEVEKIVERYQRRKGASAGWYAAFRPEVVASTQERLRALVSLFVAHGINDLATADVLEIGCGGGRNLLELLLLGAAPERLLGNDLQPERIDRARRVLPESVRLFPGDATALPFAPASFDIVYQSVVFSSVLDTAFQQRMADAMWRWVRPGGGVLWYDFTYDNPANPDVRGIPLRRVRELFPKGLMRSRRVTLAPPISRRVVRIHPSMYGLFNALPLLRTHLLCLIEKP